MNVREHCSFLWEKNMPKDKTESHNRILEAAKREFLEYGFADASLRRIASQAGIMVSGLYKHFANKEEMFAALVDPAIDGFMDLYREIEGEYFDELDRFGKSDNWTGQSESVRAMEYIFDHIDAFKLIICCSGGTKYEDFIHEAAILEEKVTFKYMKELRSKGYKIKNVNKKEFHLLITAYVEAMFEPVSHDFTRKEAMHFAKTLEAFYEPAWKVLFGL